MKKSRKKNRLLDGFTLVELMVVIGIITIITSSSAAVYNNLQPSTDIGESSFMVKQLIRNSRNESVNGINNTNHGLYFDTTQNMIISYEGNSYSERNTVWDKEVSISSNLVVSPSISDVNFNKWSGFPAGPAEIRFSNGLVEDKIIRINTLGLVDLD